MAKAIKCFCPDVKTLFTSGYTEDSTILGDQFDMGTAFLPKPYTPIALARKVREILDAIPQPEIADFELKQAR